MHCRRSSRVRAPGRQQGAALIVAMLVFALATALVVAMKSDFNRFFQRSANILLDEQIQAYLRGAEDLASMALLADYDQDKTAGLPRDDLTELWSKTPPPYDLDNIGWMRGTLEDLQGRFNLNHLAKRVQGGTPAVPVRFTAAQEQFIRLLQALGEPAVNEQEAIMITESISDWLDADPNPLPDGAEDDYYSGMTPAYRTGNRAMASVSELRAVAYMTPAIYQALQPWVTVWPADPQPLNIHTAPAMVLRTINTDKNLNPLSEAEGEELVNYRGDTRTPSESNFKDITAFFANPVFADKGDNFAAIKPLLGQSTSYFLLTAESEVAGRNMRLYSVLQRQNRKIDAIARAGGSL